MKNRQLSLSDIQKDYISKEEFYQIAHICKETALWLIETGRVSAEKPKRKGFGYKIAKEEVERYLADRQQNPLYYLKGKRHNCIPYTPPQPYSSELGGAIRLAVEQEMSSLPDLLTEKQVCAILGYRPKQILKESSGNSTSGDSRQKLDGDSDGETFGENRQRYNARKIVADFFGVTEYEIRKAIKLAALIPPLADILENSPRKLPIACAELIADYGADSQRAFVLMF